MNGTDWTSELPDKVSSGGSGGTDWISELPDKLPPPPQQPTPPPPPSLTPATDKAITESVTVPRPSFAMPIAKGIDWLASTLSGGRVAPHTLENLLGPPPPELPNIPYVPPQQGIVPQIAAGAANIPIGFANFATSPEGVATLYGLGGLPATLQRMAGLGFAGHGIYSGITAPSLQEKVTGIGGGALIGGLTGLDIYGGRGAVEGGDLGAVERSNAQMEARAAALGIKARAPGAEQTTSGGYYAERAPEGAPPGGALPPGPEALGPDEFQRAAQTGPLADAVRAAGGWREAAYDATRTAHAEGRPINAELWDTVNVDPPVGYERKGPVYEPQEPPAAARVQELPEAGPIGAAMEAIKGKEMTRVGTEQEFFGKIWPKMLRETGLTTRNPLVGAERAVADLAGFLKENPQFKDYYEKDFKRSRRLMERGWGQKISDAHFRLFRLLNGLMSQATPLKLNTRASLNGVRHFIDKGNFDAIKTRLITGTDSLGRPYTARALDPNNPFAIMGGAPAGVAHNVGHVLNTLIKRFGGGEKGINGAIDHLEQEVPKKELQAFNKEMGFRGVVADMGPIEDLVQFATGQKEKIPRMFIFGKKIGAYTLNNLGDARYNTTDVWESRYIKSYLKGMLEKNPGIAGSANEHEVLQTFVEEFNKIWRREVNPKEKNSAMQAGRWFHIIDAATKAGYTRGVTNDVISQYVKEHFQEGQPLFTPGGRFAARRRAEGYAAGAGETPGGLPAARVAEPGEVESFVDTKNVPPENRSEAIDGITRTLSHASDPSLAVLYEEPSQGLFDFGVEGVAQGPTQVPHIPERFRARAERSAEAIGAVAAGEGRLAAEQLRQNENRASIVIPELVRGERPGFDVAGTVIASPSDLAMLLESVHSPYQESLKVAAVDPASRRLETLRIVHVGTLNESIAHPRDIIRELQDIKQKFPNAQLYFAHNHPSGKVWPSAPDVRLTDTVHEAASYANLRVEDHLITEGGEFYSFDSQDSRPVRKSTLRPWEVMRQREAPKVTQDTLPEMAAAMRNGDPNAAHIFFRGNQGNLIALERVPDGTNVRAIEEAIMKGVAREGAGTVAVNLPAGADVQIGYRRILERLQRVAHYATSNPGGLVDASWPGTISAFSEGFLPRVKEPAGPAYGGKVARPGFRQEPAPGDGGLPADLHDIGEAAQAPVNQAAAEAVRGTMLERLGGALRNVGDWFTVKPIPKLDRAGSADAAYAHASARNSVVHTVRQLLAEVFPDQYKNPEAMKATGDILTKDNILGLRDQIAGRLQDPDLTPQGRKALEKSLHAIDDAHDMAAYDRDVRNAMNDPVISGNIERWKKWVNPEMDKMYGELRAADPNQVFEPRGRHFDARINLLPKDRAAELASFTDVTKTMPQSSVSNYRNPNVRRDPFARKAKGTGEYDTDPFLILTNTLGGRWNEVTKLRFYNDLVAKGNAIMTDGPRPAVTALGGESLRRLPIKVPETTKEGAPRTVEKSLWVKESLVPEIKSVLDVDSHAPNNPVFRWVTGVQLLQATDMVAHLKNIHTVVANALGQNRAWQDAVRKMPFLATADTVARIAKVTRDVLADTPAIRAEIAAMSRQGLIRPKYPSIGIQKITKGQEIIHDVDTAARITMNRFWDNLVARGMVEDTLGGRRKFVQQIGEYNRRLMGPTMRFLRDIGASPFVVAGRTFNSFSRKLLLGSPGFKAKTTGAAVSARAQMISGLAGATILPAIVNYITTGQMGGRPGTPVGAIDTGLNNDKGQMRLIDVFQLMGIRRGLRGTGLQATIEGFREGKTVSQIGGKAIDDITSTLSHPWLGPGLGAIYSTFSGKRLDLRGGAWPYIAKQVPEGGLHQYAENLRVTLKNQNPLIYSLVAPLFGATEDIGQDVLDYSKRIGQAAWKAPASALGYQERPPGSAFEPQYLRKGGSGRLIFGRPQRRRAQGLRF